MVEKISNSFGGFRAFKFHCWCNPTRDMAMCEQVANAFCRLLDQNTNGELARYTLTGGGPHTGMVMAKVFRESGSWKLQAIGEGIAARSPAGRFARLAPA